MGDIMATNYAKASYTEVIDLQTTNGETSIIGIHTPVGVTPYRRLQGFFMQFRKFKYKGISSLVMVPAANLPVDPLGLTGVVGTTDLMDPRDNLNPILFHGAHGENLNGVLDTIYSADEYIVNGESVSTLGRNLSDSCNESLISNATSDLIGQYYRSLTDTSWKKFGIQNGVRLRGLHPLVHKLARNTPLLPSAGGVGQNAGQLVGLGNVTNRINTDTSQSFSSTSNIAETAAHAPIADVPNVTVWDGTNSGYLRPEYAQEFTNGVTSLGWLPTTVKVQSSESSTRIMPTGLPKIFMGVLVMPPAYNVEQYFRMVIRHEFEFKEFTSSLGSMGYGSFEFAHAQNLADTAYYNWIDYSDAKAVEEISKLEGVDSAGSTIDMIGGSSEVISDGVA